MINWGWYNYPMPPAEEHHCPELEACAQEVASLKQQLAAKVNELEVSFRTTALVYRITSTFASFDKREEIINFFLQELAKSMEAEIGIIFMQNDEHMLVPEICFGLPSNQCMLISLLPKSFVGQAVSTNKISRFLEEPLASSVKASIVIPMENETTVKKGALFLGRHREQAFSLEEEQTLLILVNRLMSTLRRIEVEETLIQEKRKLEQAFKELQTMNTFMVDREVRMVVLKKELAKYKKTTESGS
jgi:transcriptional regulator with GAF, ATPase, and Fis domain